MEILYQSPIVRIFTLSNLERKDLDGKKCQYCHENPVSYQKVNQGRYPTLLCTVCALEYVGKAKDLEKTCDFKATVGALARGRKRWDTE